MNLSTYIPCNACKVGRPVYNDAEGRSLQESLAITSDRLACAIHCYLILDNAMYNIVGSFVYITCYISCSRLCMHYSCGQIGRGGEGPGGGGGGPGGGGPPGGVSRSALGCAGASMHRFQW